MRATAHENMLANIYLLTDPFMVKRRGSAAKVGLLFDQNNTKAISQLTGSSKPC
jgi:hypothetical protein